MFSSQYTPINTLAVRLGGGVSGLGYGAQLIDYLVNLQLTDSYAKP